jgi:hypothetical protein
MISIIPAPIKPRLTTVKINLIILILKTPSLTYVSIVRATSMLTIAESKNGNTPDNPRNART